MAVTDLEFREIDEHLASLGWHFNSGNEAFEKADGSRLELEDIVVALPHLSLKDLMTFERKQAVFHKQAG